jgi:hypothetical protein
VITVAEVFAIEQYDLDIAPEVQRGFDGVMGVVEERI